MCAAVTKLGDYREEQREKTKLMMQLVGDALSKLGVVKNNRHHYLFVDIVVYYGWYTQQRVMTHEQIDTCIFYTRLVRALTKLCRDNSAVQDTLLLWMWVANLDPPCNGKKPADAILDGGREFLENLVTTLESRQARRESPSA